jgi:threonine dehydrogenase-like Zn-dependent dehydrogenase
MKAAVVRTRRREIGLADLPAPTIVSDRDVELQPLEVGICGTDREIAAFDYGEPPAGEDHLIIGHEALAEVVRVGPGVAGVAPGDLVVPMVRRPCPIDWCMPCRADRPDFCYSGEYVETGIRRAHGYMAERAVVDCTFLAPVDPELRDFAVLTEPLTIAEKALAQVALIQSRLPRACRLADDGGDPDVPLGKHAVVLGAGPVGILGAMALAARGYRTWVYSRDPRGSERAQLIASFAEYVSAREHDIASLERLLGNIDLVYEAMGAAKPSFEMLAHIGRNAVFVFTGVPGRKAPIEIDADRIMRELVLNNQVVLGTVNAGRDAFTAALAHLREFEARWPQALRSMIAARHPLEDFEQPLKERLPGVKHVVSLTPLHEETR